MREKRANGTFGPVDPMRRFLSKILIDDGCWPWIGMKSTSGYGVFSVGARWNYPAQRFSYEQFVGEIPPRCNIRHNCNNRECVRPDHLEIRPLDAAKKDRITTRKIRHRKAHPEIYRVRKLFNFALYNGHATRPDKCASCGSGCVPQGHHPDYSRPYFVAWLCQRCHLRVHGKGAPLNVDGLAIDYAHEY